MLDSFEELLSVGNQVLIVSKPKPTCIKRLCEELTPYKGSIVFRFSIGSADNRTLRFWEPNAPSLAERIASLRHAREEGFATSVSCEPMLDGDIGAVISAVRPYVSDSIWLGKINRLRQIILFNCPGDNTTLRRAESLMALQSDSNIQSLYKRFHRDPHIKWKDSIKRIVGLAPAHAIGIDV